MPSKQKVCCSVTTAQGVFYSNRLLIILYMCCFKNVQIPRRLESDVIQAVHGKKIKTSFVSSPIYYFSLNPLKSKARGLLLC